MRKLILPLIALTLSTGFLHAQSSYWIFFTDKGKTGPSESWYDKPVNPEYLQGLSDEGMKVVATSKWLNAAVVKADRAPEELAGCLDFVKTVQGVRNIQTSGIRKNDKRNAKTDGSTRGDRTYGAAAVQNDMLNIAWLHKRGFKGQQVRMGVFDAGFYGVDTIPAFQPAWQENRIRASYDFVDNDSSVFDADNHGLSVLSTIAANQAGVLVGTAPLANFVLARTENNSSETHTEEYNWVRAMEWADSIGVDIIHTSLGYSTFDSAQTQYTYANLNGNETIITRAADIAASRGILVVTSAGNEGFSSWQYITAPCDADSILCVGSVDSTGYRSWFTSKGPTADGRIRPQVAALGTDAATIGWDGAVNYGNGTSYAAPQVAGLAACLLQAHPNRSNMDIIEAIGRSGNRFAEPDSAYYGYGIPNARIADSLLTQMDSAAVAANPDGFEPQHHFRFDADEKTGEMIVRNFSGKYEIEQIELKDGRISGAKKYKYDRKAMDRGRVQTSDLPKGKYKLIVSLRSGITFSVLYVKQ